MAPQKIEQLRSRVRKQALQQRSPGADLSSPTASTRVLGSTYQKSQNGYSPYAAHGDSRASTAHVDPATSQGFFHAEVPLIKPAKLDAFPRYATAPLLSSKLFEEEDQEDEEIAKNALRDMQALGLRATSKTPSIRGQELRPDVSHNAAASNHQQHQLSATSSVKQSTTQK
jgi:hypothetical protein